MHIMFISRKPTIQRGNSCGFDFVGQIYIRTEKNSEM